MIKDTKTLFIFFNRKGTLLRNNIITILAVATEVTSYYVKSYEVLIVGRFIMGVSAGKSVYHCVNMHRDYIIL